MSLTYTLVAQNTATRSDNKIHDDAVARQYGFAGGLVPGVDVYAYMTHVPAEAWGLAWLGRGTMRARFVSPVYEGDAVTVEATLVDPAARRMTLELRSPAGEVCAQGEAGLPDGTVDITDRTWCGPGDPVADPPDASPESLPPGRQLVLSAHRFRADKAAEYLASIGETLPLFAAEGVAHPGWLLRDANYVLASNVRLGPWIHVESVTRHLGVVRDGETVDTRATVTREWEHRGHRFVELDVALFAEHDRQIARVTHTAIYRPRTARQATTGGGSPPPPA